MSDQDIIQALLAKIGPAYQLPAETLDKAIIRLKAGILQLRALRAQLPSLVLEPYIQEADAHITQVANRLADEFALPQDELVPATRQEQQAAAQPPVPSAPPEGVPAAGTQLYSVGFHSPALVIAHIPTGKIASPEEFEVVILTADGRIHTVKPEDLQPLAAGPGPGPIAPKLSPGSRVKVKPLGKTGYVSEVADATAIIALDEGGFLTVPITDLEPV